MEKKRSKKPWIIAAVIVFATAAAGGAALLGKLPVTAAAAEVGEVIRLVKEVGTVEAVTAVVIYAENAGKIEGITSAEGDSVLTGDLLLKPDAGGAQMDVNSLQAQLDGLQSQYRQARETADRNKLLYEQGAMSYEDYSAADTAARSLEAQVSSMSFSIKGLEKSTGIAGVTAPISGTVTGVFVSEGEAVLPGTPLFEISDLSQIQVKADLIALDADAVEPGDAVEVYDSDGNLLDGNAKVSKVHVKAQEKVSELGISQKRVSVEIRLSEGVTPRLGSDVAVEIAAERKENVLRVPQQAVFEKSEGDFVYAIESGKAALRQVETGLSGDDCLEIREGLSEGALVILSPSGDIGDGTRVKIKDDITIIN